MQPLRDHRIAVLAEEMYEDLELWYPLIRMREAGAQVVVVGTEADTAYHGKHGLSITADVGSGDVTADDFDAVIVPGGYAPDRMRRHADTLALVRGVFEAGGVVAMICHAGWVPISAGIVADKNVTSTPAIKDDLINAGAQWADQEVVKDDNLISSRSPDDLPAFCQAIIAVLQEA
jgi:protease I